MVIYFVSIMSHMRDLTVNKETGKNLRHQHSEGRPQKAE